jgi:hypothetical protein
MTLVVSLTFLFAHTVAIFQPIGHPQGYLSMEWGDIRTLGGYNRFETGAAR